MPILDANRLRLLKVTLTEPRLCRFISVSASGDEFATGIFAGRRLISKSAFSGVGATISVSLLVFVYVNSSESSVVVNELVPRGC